MPRPTEKLILTPLSHPHSQGMQPSNSNHSKSLTMFGWSSFRKMFISSSTSSFGTWFHPVPSGVPNKELSWHKQLGYNARPGFSSWQSSLPPWRSCVDELFESLTTNHQHIPTQLAQGIIHHDDHFLSYSEDNDTGVVEMVMKGAEFERACLKWGPFCLAWTRAPNRLACLRVSPYDSTFWFEPSFSTKSRGFVPHPKAFTEASSSTVAFSHILIL